jgi:hypothetical protein
MDALDEGVGFNVVQLVLEHVGKPVCLGLGGIELAKDHHPLGKESRCQGEKVPTTGLQGEKPFANGHPWRGCVTCSKDPADARASSVGDRECGVTMRALVPVQALGEPGAPTGPGKCKAQPHHTSTKGACLGRGRRLQWGGFAEELTQEVEVT